MKTILLLILAMVSTTSQAMHYDPVELVDYIFDRYSYLDLDQNASKKEIAAEIKTQRTQNHPDRTAKLGADLQKQARQNWARLEDCAQILLNDELRPLFDQRLNEFRTNRPKLISPEGHAIIDLESNFVDLAMLTGENQSDAAETIARIEDFVGFKPKEFERSKKLWTASPEDSDFIELYRSALEKKLLYLELIEKVYWAKAGIRGKAFTSAAKPSFDPSAFPEVVAKQIEHVKSNVIPSFAQARNELLALGYDKNPALLLTADKSTSGQNPKPLTTELVSNIEKAQAKFLSLSEAITQNAAEKSETMMSLLALSPFELLHSADENKVTIYLMDDKSGENSFENGKVILVVHFNDGALAMDPPQDLLTLADLRKHSFDSTAAAVIFNRPLNQPTLDFGAAYKRVMLSFGKEVDLN